MFRTIIPPGTSACVLSILVAGGLTTGSGCSYLKVTKVGVNRRASECDGHIKGFRYYLSRPYVAVLKPIPVRRETEFVVLDPHSPHADIEAELKKTFAPAPATPAAADVAPMTEQELARVRGQLSRYLASRQDELPGSPAADEIRQVGFHQSSQPAVNVDIHAPPATVVGANAGVAGVDSGILYGDRDTYAESRYDLTDDYKLPEGPGDCAKSWSTEGAIRILFLPDMEEQYAVHHHNFASNSQYKMSFQDGWMLRGVDGEFDSTDVVEDIFKTIDAAVNSAKTLGVTRLGGTPGEAAADLIAVDAAKMTGKDGVERLVFQVTRTTFIKPGMYRINKPWECDSVPPVGLGLLQQLGLPVDTTVTIAPANLTQPGSKAL